MSIDVLHVSSNKNTPIIRPDLPEPTSFSGRNFIELSFPAEYFKQKAKARCQPKLKADPSTMTLEDVTKAMKSGFTDEKIVGDSTWIFGKIKLVTNDSTSKYGEDSEFKIVSDLPISPKLANLTPNEVYSMVQKGKKLVVYQSLYGTLTYTFISATHESTDKGERLGEGCEPEPRPESGSRPSAFDFRIFSRSVSGPSAGINAKIDRYIGGRRYRDVKNVEVKVGDDSCNVSTRDEYGIYWSATITLTGTADEIRKTILTVTAKDAGNNTLDEKNFNFIISFTNSKDNTPPVITILKPTESQSFIGDIDGYELEISGSAADPPDAQTSESTGVKSVEFAIDDGSFTAVIPKAANDYSSWTASVVINQAGSHVLRVIAMDMPII